MACEMYAIGVIPVLMGITLLLGGVCGGGLWPAKAAGCDTFLVAPVLFVALGMVLCGILLCVAVRIESAILTIGVVVSFYLLSILLMAFAIFGLLVTTTSRGGGGGGDGGVLEAKGGHYNRHFALGDYSPWLHRRVSDDRVWNGIRRCLMKREECKTVRVLAHHQKPEEKPGLNSIIKWSGLQSGCCKPPDDCGFTAINVTESLYDPPASPTPSFFSNLDCLRFDKGGGKCFSCDSCRAAFLDSLRRSWYMISIINFVIASLVACSARE